MNCKDLFASVSHDPEKAEKIDKEHPECTCENVSVSSHSNNGPVGNDEIVWRLILSPIHYDFETRSIKEAAFSDTRGRGMSVLRENVIGSQDLILQRGRVRAATIPSRAFVCAVGANVEAIRNLRSLDGKGRFCVYDTAEVDEPAHADICQTRHSGRAAQKQLRRELQKLFYSITPPLPEIDT